jgi:hypothetical protein
MADLDFKHNVPDVAKGAALPEYKGGNVKPEVIPTPDYQGTLSKYGADTNFLSSLGSTIATQASHAIATKLGGELGKNPVGELSPPITDFDKTLNETYAAQAQATLGIKADQLITDSNLAMAKVPRITPELIARTNQQISLGLQNIFKDAPSSIRSRMEYQYQAQQISQSAQLTTRMIGEQRTDQKNTIDLATKNNNQQAFSSELNGVDLDKDGNSKAALAAVAAVNKQQDSLLATHNNTTPLEVQAAKDAAEISRLAGKQTRLAMIAQKENKLPEFYKSLADNKSIPDKYKKQVIDNTLEYMNMQQRLRNDDQNLQSQLMHNRIASGDFPSDSEWAKFQQDVGPYKAEQMRFNLIQAKKSGTSQKIGIDELSNRWGDPEAHANATADIQNATFNKKVAYTMQQNPNLSKDDAEVQVAVPSGAPIPVLIKSINNKLTSGNPQNIESGHNQIQSLRDMEAGHALIGLSKQADAIATQFTNRRGSMPDSDLARQITDNILNVDESKQKILDNAWGKILDKGGAGGLGSSKPLYKFALDEAGIGRKDFGGKYFQVIYGNDIYTQLKANFDASGGDYETAKQMTNDYIKEKYGDTQINGTPQFTDSPIEKTLGYKDDRVVPFIQQDLLNHLNKEFEKHKDEGTGTWSIMPLAKKGNGILSSNYAPAEIMRTVKTAKGEQRFKYPVNLVGRPGGHWDVVVQTPSGPRNFFLVAPNLGIQTYKPNAEAIRKNYNEHVTNKGWF